MTPPLKSSAQRGASDAGERRSAVSWRDAQTLGRIRAGDAEVFDALMRELGPALVEFAGRYVGSDDAAEEVVQDVFVNVWMQRQSIVVRDTVKTYLYRAVRNRALNMSRDLASRREALAQMASVRSGGRERVGGLAEPEARLQSAQLADAVRTALEGLPPRWKLAFELVREHQLSYEEAAAVMGTTVKSIDMSLGRAVKALRKSLRKVWP